MPARRKKGPARLYLLDASVYVFRSWFALPDTMTDPVGRPVNAVYGFARFLGDFLEAARPLQAAVAFDESLTSSYRNEIYPDYKANREEPPEELELQFERCRALVRALGLAEFASPRYEADDIIGTLAARAHEEGRPVTIVTRDKDLVQLMREGDELWDLAGGRRLDYAAAAQAYGVPPERMADYLALTGDSVDNIPGVPGIGAKTASALMAHFASLEELLADPSAIGVLKLRGTARIRRALEEHADAARLAQQLTRIPEDVPLELDGYGLTRRAPELGELFALYDTLGFGDALRTQAENLARAYAELDLGLAAPGG